ncbi:hypothetical protein CRG98_026714 [Punica granatum]|uniref:Nodulin-like domain-containing protein n=1 Tax=Punica granatum TaxID=22663 RepID=A0A2I0JA85_PUNGR|nr:hypothetical protein CRG98_026714 [Punica granatum]
MNLNQVELNNLSITEDVGKAFRLLDGLASDRLPMWMILLIGSVEGLVGYGAQWLVVSEKITLSYWQASRRQLWEIEKGRPLVVVASVGRGRATSNSSIFGRSRKSYHHHQ